MEKGKCYAGSRVACLVPYTCLGGNSSDRRQLGRWGATKDLMGNPLEKVVPIGRSKHVDAAVAIQEAVRQCGSGVVKHRLLFAEKSGCRDILEND